MRPLAALVVALALICGTPAPVIAAPVPIYTTEAEAQQSCPTDVVVWVNLKTGVYHFKGQRWYANTASGAFICRTAADKSGSRATRNGQ
jgi:hypothetical protein